MVIKRLLSLFLACVMALNLFGCSGSQASRSYNHGDAGVVSPAHVSLLGLPDLAPDASSRFSDAPLFVPNNQSGELIVPLRQDASAPFNGVLLNGPAVARVTIEFQAQQERCSIERNHDVGLVTARYNADVATLRLAMSTQERTANVLLSGRDQELARLNRLLSSQTNSDSGPHIGEGLIWTGAGFILGVLVVGGVVIYVNSHP